MSEDIEGGGVPESKGGVTQYLDVDKGNENDEDFFDDIVSGPLRTKLGQ